MASSIYIYDGLTEFENFYKGLLDNPIKKIKIFDLYINNNSQLWIVTNTNTLKERPTLKKSMVHFRNGSITEYKTEKTTLVLYNKLEFDRKRLKLKFYPRFLRKPLLEWKVDRYIQNNLPKKQKKIDYDHRYYDLEFDRINLILKT